MGFVPLYHRYYEGATTSCFPFRRLSFPSVGDTSLALIVLFRAITHLLKRLRADAWGLELFIPLSPPVF